MSWFLSRRLWWSYSVTVLEYMLKNMSLFGIYWSFRIVLFDGELLVR